MGQQVSTPSSKSEDNPQFNKSKIYIIINLNQINTKIGLSQQASINTQKQYLDNSIPNVRQGPNNPYPQPNPNHNQYNQINQNSQMQRPNIPRKNYKGSK